jgi:hypothetical protein
MVVVAFMFRHQTKPFSLMKLWFSIGVVLVLLASACSGAATTTIPPTPSPGTTAGELELQRDADVPDLPFPDNADPNACGIPTPYGGGTAWVTGVYQGQMVEPMVLLYDSHERLHITGAVPSGTPVQVQLYQGNPVLDFYYVQSDTPNGPEKGWVPAPFLQFSPPSS